MKDLEFFSISEYSGLNGGLWKVIYLCLNSLSMWLFGAKVFAEQIKLRILKWRDDPRSSRWAFKQRQVSLLKTHTGIWQKRRQCDHRGRDWSEGKEHPEPPKAGGGEGGFTLEPLEGARPCQLLDFRLPACRHRENKSVVLSPGFLEICPIASGKPYRVDFRVVVFFNKRDF